jgi:hypothetical protein
MTCPYTKIPDAVYTALEQHEIDMTQFLILSACYHWANRAEGYRVNSYSAERVCQLFGLGTALETLKRFQRGLRNLADRGIVKHDYRRGKERTYHVWVPDVESESAASLYSRQCRRRSEDIVVVSSDASVDDTGTSKQRSDDSVAVVVTTLSTTNQEISKSEKESPLNPPSGGLLPSLRSPLKGEDAGTGQKPPRECLINECALQYVDFVNLLYGFVPDVKQVTSLMREFHPTEIFCAQVMKFPLWDKPSHRVMAHFFASGAKPLIEAARLNGESTKGPKLSLSEYPGALIKWSRVQDAYAKVFGQEKTS